MKSIKIWSIALLGSMIMAPAWSHHPAEGIISDDIWQRIDDHLREIESPHLNIDFDDAMSSMRVREDPNQGCQLLVSTITVREQDVADYAAHMEFALDELMQEMGRAGQVSPGGFNNRTCNTPGYEVNDLDNGLSEMNFYEPIVAETGQSDTPPAAASGTAPGTPPAASPGTPPETPPGKGGN